MAPVFHLTNEQIRVLKKHNADFYVSKTRFGDGSKKVFVLGKLGVMKGLENEILEPILTPLFPIKESMWKTKELIDKIDETIKYVLDLTIAFSDDEEFIRLCKDLLQEYEEQKAILKAIMIRIKDRPKYIISVNDGKKRCILCSRRGTGEYCDRCKKLIQELDEDLRKFLYWENKKMFEMLVKISEDVGYYKLFSDSSAHDVFNRLEGEGMISINHYAFPKETTLTKKGKKILNIVRKVFDDLQ